MVIEQDNITFVRMGPWCCAVLASGVMVCATSWTELMRRLE
jgi:hypothetical protein